jgi:hypothetical protein
MTMARTRPSDLFPPLPADHPLFKRGFVIGMKRLGDFSTSGETPPPPSPEETPSPMPEPENVARDADPDCRACNGRGWHWGWDVTGAVTAKGKLMKRTGALPPVMLRCPCVDQRRVAMRHDT